MIKKDRLIERFMDYVQIDSESRDEKRMADRLIREIKQLGIDVYTDDTREMTGSNANNIYAYLEGDEKEEPLLFLAHLDTVTPGKGIKPFIEGDYIKSGEGTILGGDNKAGITAIMESLKTIKENKLNNRPIEIIFTVCEEIGLLGARNLDYGLIKSKSAMVLDSSGQAGKIITQSACIYEMNVEIRGRASHAGVAPEKGISAIIVAAEAIANMKLLRIDKETTANIGSIIAQGPTNIVSDKVKMQFEIRSLSEEKAQLQIDHMAESLTRSVNKHKAQMDYEIESGNKAFSIDEDAEFIKLIEDKTRKIGIEPYKTFSTAGFDANVLNENGIDAVILSNGSENAHSLEERLNIIEFEKFANLVLELMVL